MGYTGILVRSLHPFAGLQGLPSAASEEAKPETARPLNRGYGAPYKVTKVIGGEPCVVRYWSSLH
jgi:hypothetical protein